MWLQISLLSKTLISAPLYKPKRTKEFSSHSPDLTFNFVEGKFFLHHRFLLYPSFCSALEFQNSPFCNCTYRRLSGSLYKCLLSSILVRYYFIVFCSLSTSFWVYRPISCPPSTGFESDDEHFLIHLSPFIDWGIFCFHILC